MQPKKTLFLFFALFSCLLSFSQNSDLVRYFPPNATGIVSFSIPRVTGKIPRETFRESSIYKQLTKDSSKVAANLLFSDIQNSGIDLSTDLFLVTVFERTEEDAKKFVHVFGKVTNEGLFTQTIQKVFHEKMINNYGTDKMVFEDGGTIAWNKDVFVLTMGNDRSLMNYKPVSDDTTDVNQYEKFLTERKEKMQKAQRDLSFALLTPKPGNEYMVNERFVEFINTPADIKMWNLGGSNPLMGNIPGLNLFSRMQPFNGALRTTIINFENGKVISQGRNYSTPAVKEVYAKYPQAVVSADLAKRLPPGKLLGMINCSYNPEMIIELMNKSMPNDILDSLKKNIPFDLKLFSSAFKGNFLLAAVIPDQTDPADSTTKKMDGIQILVAIPIADKAKFEELKTAIRPLFDSIKKKDSGKERTKPPEPFVYSNDEIVVLSNSAFAANAFLKHPGNNMIADELKAYAYPMHAQINLKDILQELFVNKSRQNRRAGVAELQIINALDQVIVYGGNLDKESFVTTTEIRLTDKSENALVQVFRIVNNLNTTLNLGKSRREVVIEDITQEKKKVEPPPPPPPPPKKPKSKPKGKNE